MIDLKVEATRIYELRYDTERESEWERVARSIAAERDALAAELATLAYVPAGPPCALRDCRDKFGVVQYSGDIWWVYRIDWCIGAWLRNVRGVDIKLDLDQLDRPVLPLKRQSGPRITKDGKDG